MRHMRHIDAGRSNSNVGFEIDLVSRSWVSLKGGNAVHAGHHQLMGGSIFFWGVQVPPNSYCIMSSPV